MWHIKVWVFRFGWVRPEAVTLRDSEGREARQSNKFLTEADATRVAVAAFLSDGVGCRLDFCHEG